jgi:hypothetical protein
LKTSYIFLNKIFSIIGARLQTFFQGKAKFSRGTKTYYLPKNILFSFLKVEKHTILVGQGGGGKCPLLPSPAEAHVFYENLATLKVPSCSPVCCKIPYEFVFEEHKLFVINRKVRCKERMFKQKV